MAWIHHHMKNSVVVHSVVVPMQKQSFVTAAEKQYPAITSELNPAESIYVILALC